MLFSQTPALAGTVSAAWNGSSCTQYGSGIAVGLLEAHAFRCNNVTGATGNAILTKTNSGDDGARFDCAGVKISGLTSNTDDGTFANSSGTSANWSSTSTTTTNANDAVVAFFSGETDTGTTVGTWQSSFTRLVRVGDSAGGCCVLDYGYRVVSGTGAYTGAVNGNVSSNYLGYVAAFK